jgi:hypothetical protein
MTEEKVLEAGVPALIRPIGSGAWRPISADPGPNLRNVTVETSVLEKLSLDTTGSVEIAFPTGDGVLMSTGRVATAAGQIQLNTGQARFAGAVQLQYLLPSRLSIPEMRDGLSRYRSVAADIVGLGLTQLEVVSSGASAKHQLAVLSVPLGGSERFLLVERTATCGTRFSYRVADSDPGVKAGLAEVIIRLVGRGLARFPDTEEAAVA